MEKFLSVAAIVIALGVGAVSLNASGIVGPVGPQGPKGEQGIAGKDGKDGLDGKKANTFGAVSVLNSPLEVNGVSTYFLRTAVRTASTSLCSLKSPAATTTLVSATASVTGGNVYANDFQLGFGTVPGATTTSLARLTLAANTAGVAIATSTNLVQSFGNGGKDGQIPPNTFINFNVSTSSASATFAPTGACVVELRSI